MKQTNVKELREAMSGHGEYPLPPGQQHGSHKVSWTVCSAVPNNSSLCPKVYDKPGPSVTESSVVTCKQIASPESEI